MKNKYIIETYQGEKTIKIERIEDTEEGVIKLVETIRGIMGEEYQVRYFEE